MPGPRTRRTSRASVTPTAGSRPAPGLEDWCRDVIEASPDGIVVVDADGRIVAANPALAELTGWPRAELIGRRVEVLLPDELRSRHVDLRREYTARPRTRPMGAERPLRLRRADGSGLPVEIALAPLPSASPGTTLATVRDVSERSAVDAERLRAARRAARVTQCVADVARAALERRPEGVIFERIASGVLESLDADTAAILLSGSEPGSGRDWGAAVGRLAGPLVEALHADSTGALLARLTPSTAITLPGPPPGLPEPLAGGTGPTAVVPFGHIGSSPSGGLVACRGPGGTPFAADDVALLARLADETQVALHLSRARADQQRLTLLEERQRIARELHDTVIQDVIAVGMQISADVDTETDLTRREHALERVAQLEGVTRNLRRAVFELRGSTHRVSAPNDVNDVVSEATRMLGHSPTVTFSGRVDELPEPVADDLLAALREALVNVARHAGARHTTVSVTVGDDAVTLVVVDDGVGPPRDRHTGYGLGYVEDRARRHGGRLSLAPGPVTGTRLVWSCPLEPQSRRADPAPAEPER